MQPPDLAASGLPRLPAPARLKRVLEALAQALPGDFATLLAAPRFERGAAALARMSQAAQRDAAVQGLAPAEVEWLADELLQRWQRLGAPPLPPAIAIRMPDDDRSDHVVLELCAEGILPDWTARWHGAEPAPDAASASVSMPPANVRVHVHARSAHDGARLALVAEATVARRTCNEEPPGFHSHSG